MNKRLLSFLVFTVLSAQHLAFATPMSADELAAAVKTAIDNNDSSALFALYNWTGVDADTRSEIEQGANMVFGNTDTSISVVSQLGNFKQSIEARGARYTFTVPLLGYLAIQSSGGKTKIPYGQKEGVYYLAALALDAGEQPSVNQVSCSIRIVGPSDTNAPSTFAGYYIALNNSKETRENFTGNAGWTMVFWADDVKEFVVTNTAAQGTLKVWITKGTQTIFQSPETNALTVAYPAPNAPANLTASLVGPTTAALTWNTSYRAQSYRVWRKVIGADAAPIAAASMTSTNFTLENLPWDSTIEIYVSAVNIAGESQLSQKATLTTPSSLSIQEQLVAAGKQWTQIEGEITVGSYVEDILEGRLNQPAGRGSVGKVLSLLTNNGQQVAIVDFGRGFSVGIYITELSLLEISDAGERSIEQQLVAAGKQWTQIEGEITVGSYVEDILEGRLNQPEGRGSVGKVLSLTTDGEPAAIVDFGRGFSVGIYLSELSLLRVE